MREVEERLETAREWEVRPKPTAPQPPPADIQDKKLFFEKFDLMLSMAQLAFESDSTRIVTLMVDAFLTPAFKLSEERNTTDSYHGLSHHGQAVEKVKQLEEADRQQMRVLHQLIDSLAGKKEGGQRLLDNTMMLYGSNMGDANIHDNSNLPIILAGGASSMASISHSSAITNAPLCNLYVTMLQRMGIEAGSFGSSTGVVSELG